jgi:hypothetical protein
MLARLHALRTLLIASILFVGACVHPIAAARAGSPSDNLSSTAAEWRVMPSDGVVASLHEDEGSTGKCLRLDFNFTTGGGFVVIQRDLAIDLPENYEFAFNVKGDCKPNNLEFKILDPATGNDPTTSSVWWVNKPAYEFAKDWTAIAYKKRHFTFAWGPNGGKPHTKLGTIEFAIASNQGGKGSVWFDGLTFRALPVVKPYTGTPTATATDSFDAEHGPEKAIDGDATTAWYSEKPGASITIDYGQVREFGGLGLRWISLPAARGQPQPEHPYTVRVSIDGVQWADAAVDWNGSGRSDYLFMPDTDARFVTISARDNGIAPAFLNVLSEVAVIPIESASTLNRFLEHIASEQPRGVLPRWASKEQSFWTALGVPESKFEALINEEGQIEVGKGLFSFEPFVLDGDRLLTWADGSHTQSLAHDRYPVATVVRSHEGLTLEIIAAVAGPTDEPALAIAYTLTNTGTTPRDVSLVVAARPFQVNPPAQFLNMEGGAAAIHSVSTHDGALVVDDQRAVFPAAPVAGLTTSEQLIRDGSLMPRLSHTPNAPAVWTRDERLKSAAWVIDMSLKAGETAKWGVVVPMNGTSRPSWLPETIEGRAIKQLVQGMATVWQKELSNATLSLPPSAKAIEDTFYAQQAYIMINRDGPGFQPGSRSYERSWIRDGSMTSAAMLQLGHTEMVKEFVRWYASYQFPDGKVPCVVDARGPDPVPEHDSHGQLIMAIANVHRYTHEAAFVKDHFDHVTQAVAYIEKIRGERMTADYAATPGSKDAKTKQEPGKKAVPLRAMYGLVPESISHEGYSAKPMHSYWDDLFVYRGLKDAAYCAGVVGDAALQAKWTALAKDFGDTLAASYALTMKTHGIDYLPGCVELGDFDATSTTVALWPVQAQDILPAAAVSRTFDKYWEFFTNRRDHPRDQWEAYTPYELRTINAFVHLGQRERALAALEWFMLDQYPAGWHHWAEVVWSNPRTTKFIGDMPHTWCGSDFLNSLRSMLVYEDETKDALVLFAGVPERWAQEEGGVSFKGFRTYFGTLDAKIEGAESGIRMSFAGQLTVPKGGIVVRSVKDARSSSVIVDGKPVAEVNGAITLHTLPTEIVWKD